MTIAPIDRERDRVPSDVVHSVIERSMLFNERVMAVLRGGFCLLVLSRFFWVTEWEWHRALLEAASIVAALVFSIYVLAFARRGSVALLLVSVTVDAVTCFFALLPNIFYDKTFPSILMMPDIGVLVLMTAATGLRHSALAAVTGSALNFASFIALVLLDRSVKGPQWVNGPEAASVFALLLLGASAFATSVSARTRRLALVGANKTLEAERARSRIVDILSEHHDVRSLLSAASVNATMLERALSPGQIDSDMRVLARDVSEDLRTVSSHITHMLDDSLMDDATLELTDVEPVVRESIERVRRWFPDVTLRFEPGQVASGVLIRGGARCLARAVTNVLVNACEGNGGAKASDVEIRCFRDGDSVCVSVADDGPGFAEVMLAGPVEAGLSEKRAGSGHGLVFVSELLQRSSGTLKLGNGSGGGGRVTMRLPVRTSSGEIAVVKPEDKSTSAG